jgi:hypothetical protein
MPAGMRTVYDRAKMGGQIMGPNHPLARKMAKSIDDGEEMEAKPDAGGPPEYREADEESGDCGECRNFMESDVDGEGKCQRYGADVKVGMVCDGFQESEPMGDEMEATVPPALMGA